jgi:hypothetical protein
MTPPGPGRRRRSGASSPVVRVLIGPRGEPQRGLCTSWRAFCNDRARGLKKGGVWGTHRCEQLPVIVPSCARRAGGFAGPPAPGGLATTLALLLVPFPSAQCHWLRPQVWAAAPCQGSGTPGGARVSCRIPGALVGSVGSRCRHGEKQDIRAPPVLALSSNTALGAGVLGFVLGSGWAGGTFVPTTEQCLGSAAGGKGCWCDVGRQHGSRSGARALPKEASWSPRLPSLPFALPPSTPGKPCQLFLLTLPAPWRPGDHVVPPEIARELVHGTLPGHTGLRGVLRAPAPPRPPPAPGDGSRANPCLPPPSPARRGARVGGGAGLAGAGAPGCPGTARGRRRPQPAAKPAPRPAFRPPRAQPARRPATAAHRGSPPAPTACMNPLLARPRGVPAGASRGPRSSVAERPSVPGAPGAGPREGGDDERTPCRGEGGLARRARGTGCGGLVVVGHVTDRAPDRHPRGTFRR